MKLGALGGFLISSLLVFMSTVVQAKDPDSSGQGVQNAIDQHDKNIEKFSANHPDKDLPKGLIHSREVLESIKAGEHPELPDRATRPERPEIPDVAMRPDRPDKPVRPAKPDRPEKAPR